MINFVIRHKKKSIYHVKNYLMSCASSVIEKGLYIYFFYISIL